MPEPAKNFDVEEASDHIFSCIRQYKMTSKETVDVIGHSASAVSEKISEKKEKLADVEYELRQVEDRKAQLLITKNLLQAGLKKKTEKLNNKLRLLSNVSYLVKRMVAPAEQNCVDEADDLVTQICNGTHDEVLKKNAR
jgi:septal ring factor EnvC (AmiA/AmiB activator)